MSVTYPTVTPDFGGSHYCHSCMVERHPDRNGDRIYVVRLSPLWGSHIALCEAHLTDYVAKVEAQQR